MSHFCPIRPHWASKHQNPAESLKRVVSVKFFIVVHFQNFESPNMQKGTYFHKIEDIDRA